MRTILIKSYKFRNLAIFFLILTTLSFFTSHCTPTKMELGQTIKELHLIDTEVLKDMWLKSNFFSTRRKIVQELENRKATDALTFCLYHATQTDFYRSSTTISKKDALQIVYALGRLKDPNSIGD